MSLPGSMAPASVDLDLARRLLALPREVGRHPETGEPILAGIGRYGPWLRHEDSYAAIPADEDVLAIGLNRAVDLIADKEIRESRARGPKQVLRKLGPHPDDGAPGVAQDRPLRPLRRPPAALRLAAAGTCRRRR